LTWIYIYKNANANFACDSGTVLDQECVVCLQANETDGFVTKQRGRTNEYANKGGQGRINGLVETQKHRDGQKIAEGEG